MLDYAKDQERFSGLNTLVRHGSEEDLLYGRVAFDLDAPEANSSEYLTYREKLISQCVEFIGMDAYEQRKEPQLSSMEQQALRMQQLCQWRGALKKPPQSKWRKWWGEA